MASAIHTLIAITLLGSGGLSVAADVGGQPCLGSWMEGEAEIDGLVFGANQFEHQLDHDLAFTVERQSYGWQVQMTKEGRSLPTQTRPNGIPPQQTSGVPQTIDYVFGRDVVPPEEMIVPGGMIAPTVEPQFAASGRILLEIEEQHETEYKTRNADVFQTGYLDFKACVMWNVFPREPNKAHYNGAGLPEGIARWKLIAFEDCGLHETQLLSDRMFSREPRQQAVLEPDLDGDGATDLLALTSGPKGLTVHACLRQGRQLRSLEPASITELSHDFLEEADFWHVEYGAVAESETGDLSRAPDRVIIGIEGASSQIVSLEADGLISDWQGD